MILSDLGFRDLYQKYVFLRDEKMLEHARDLFKFTQETDSLLTYCYVDNEAGMTFEALCPAVFSIKEYFPKKSKDIRFFMRCGSISNSEISVASPDEIDEEAFSEEIRRINECYNGDSALATIRGIQEIDPLRSPEYPDDILVYIFKEGNNPEGVWMRTKVVNGGGIEGTLLNEPYADFGVHSGNSIVARFQIDDEKKTMAFCKFT